MKNQFRDIPETASNQRITSHADITQDTITDKVPVFCNRKGKGRWCSTRRFACFKAEVKYGIWCHKRNGNSRSDCPNITFFHLRS